MPEHPPAAPHMGEEVDVPALRAEKGKIGDRRLAAGQDDEIGDRQRLAGVHEDEPHVGLQPQRIEIVEIGDAREHRHGDASRGAVGARFAVAEAERVLRRQARGAAKERQRGRARASRCARRSSPCRSANRLASPRNLLTRKPTIIAASSGASTALVPTIARRCRRGRCRRSARPGIPPRARSPCWRCRPRAG